MVEFRNRNTKTEPEYFYQVSEYVTTFESDPEKNKPYTHIEKFEGKDLKKCRKDAEVYYYERKKGLESGNAKYFLPYAAPGEFELGKNAVFTITLSLIEYYDEDNFYDYPLLGEEEETTAESLQVEKAVFKHRGII